MGGAFSSGNLWEIEVKDGQVSIIGVNSEYPIGETQKVMVSGPPVALTLAVDNAQILVLNDGHRITLIGNGNSINVVGDENHVRVHGTENTFVGAGERTVVYTDDAVDFRFQPQGMIAPNQNNQIDTVPLTVNGNVREDAPARMALLDLNNNQDGNDGDERPQDGYGLIRFVYQNFSAGAGGGDASPPSSNADIGGAGDAGSGRPATGLKRDQDGDNEDGPSSKKSKGE